MAQEIERRSRSLQSRYVDSQRGWQYLFFSIAIACIAGLAFRLYLSPDRLKGWVDDALKRQKGPAAYAFDGAKIRLARGSIPEFSVVLTGVRIAPAPKCNPEPSLRIAELTLPFRFSSLFSGHFAVGTISAEDMVVDLDGFKKRCPETPVVKALEPRANAPVAKESQQPTPATEPSVPGDIHPWWTEEQIRAARSFVLGVDFKRVEIQFEERSKRIFLDSFAAEVDADSGRLDVSTELRVPPEIIYDEKVPPLRLEIRATAMRADAKLIAGFNEGRLETNAVLTPGPDRTLDVDMQLDVRNVPLSTVIPLMKKAGITDQAFQPRFLWLDCGAKIKGPFQGLFNKSPFLIENCSIEGDGTKIEIARALRHPDGNWEPLGVSVKKLDLNKLFRTLGLSGPEGIASDFGNLTGEIELRGPDDATFAGRLENAKLSFSRRSVRVEQRIARLAGRFTLREGRFRGGITDALVDNGEFAGELAFDLDRKLRSGNVKVELKTLSFDPRVQALLVDGLMGPVAGSGVALIDQGKLVSLESKLEVGKTEGREWKFEKAELGTSMKNGSGVLVTISSPLLELNKTSALYRTITPIFFGHSFDGDWIGLEKMSFDVRVPEGGGLRWSKASATLEKGRIAMSSEGAMSRERALFGWIEVDYPKAKNLKELKRRIEIDDEALGL
ncbi:MAG: hypothetical protein V4760_05435 [Bdellovibrionota bacterium]